MTIANYTMNEIEENSFMDAMDRINKAGSALRVIAWALGLMAVAGVSVFGWVWTVNDVQKTHEVEIQDIKPRVTAMEARAIRTDASPPVSREQFYELDKRLDRMEQGAITLKEQNSIILQELRNLQGKP
jgi:hypothetical protein